MNRQEASRRFRAKSVLPRESGMTHSKGWSRGASRGTTRNPPSSVSDSGQEELSDGLPDSRRTRLGQRSQWVAAAIHALQRPMPEVLQCFVGNSERREIPILACVDQVRRRIKLGAPEIGAQNDLARNRSS